MYICESVSIFVSVHLCRQGRRSRCRGRRRCETSASVQLSVSAYLCKASIHTILFLLAHARVPKQYACVYEVLSSMEDRHIMVV
jgi:hypothetical protein